MGDIYSWRVTYHDDTEITEDQAGGFANVDQARVKAVELRPGWGDDLHRVEVPDGAVPVFFRRRQIVVSPEGLTPGSITHCIGWKRGDEAVYLFVQSDGSTLLTNDLQAYRRQYGSSSR